MNEFFYESRGKEKAKELIDEEKRSQAFHRSGASKLDPMRGMPRLILLRLGILSIVELLVR